MSAAQNTSDLFFWEVKYVLTYCYLSPDGKTVLCQPFWINDVTYSLSGDYGYSVWL